MIQLRHIVVFVWLAIGLAACTRVSETVVPTHACAPMPVGRASACSCVLNGKAYVFSGRDASGNYLNDLWSYDPQTDSWTNLGEAPMNPRVNATIAAYNDKLYAGLGYSALRAYRDTAYLQDWWEYTPATGDWKRLADFPNNCSVAAQSFTVGNSIYAIYGFGHGYTRDICRYDAAADSWSVLPDNYERPNRNFGGRGAWRGGLYYYGTGFVTYSMTQWYVSDVVSDRWDKCASVPGKGRQFCACTASAKYVYLFGGRYFAGEMTGGEVFDNYLRYMPEKDQWQWCGKMPCGRAENQIAFTIDGNAYVGLGEDDKGNIINTLYRIEE